MIISLIAAVSQNYVIGKDNRLPWHLPDDMSYFMRTTLHHHVLMGRKSYDALPNNAKPLPHRTNIVVTRGRASQNVPYHAVSSPEEGLQLARRGGEKEVFVIGGCQVYTALLPCADYLYLTEIQAVVAGDVYFPKFDKGQWVEIMRKNHPIDSRHQFAFDFVKYKCKSLR